MSSTNYVYLRSLEVEGRHPQDAGAWVITVNRLMYGEGLPNPTHPLFTIQTEAGKPLPPAPKLPKSAYVRTEFYRKIRTAGECEAFLSTIMPYVNCGIDLFAGFDDDHHGFIPTPGPEEVALPISHAVGIEEPLRAERLFRFRNSWGDKWGDKGYGYLPYDYFEQHTFECMGFYPLPAYLASPKLRAIGRSYRLRQWTARDEWSQRVYGYEVLDQTGKDRLGWTFAIERDDALEIEELYVRPEHRGAGLGRMLADQLVSLFKAKKTEVRLWVPFADSRSESPDTYDALLAITRRLGLVYRPCPERWAAYLATSSTSGVISSEPIEPRRLPPRPKSSREAIRATVLAMAMVASSGETLAIDFGSRTSATAVTTRNAPSVFTQFPEVNSEAWGKMNLRRAALIRKKVWQGDDSLSEEERREFEWLQEMSQKALDEVYPRPKSDRKAIEALRAELKSKRRSGEQ